MSDLVAPQNNLTFTVKATPQRPAARKTIRRLMRMQPEIQRRLTDLARQRRQHDNKPGIRAGVEWIDRKRTTKITHVIPGEEFTLRITPQIMNDIKSVSEFLDARAAS